MSDIKIGEKTGYQDVALVNNDKEGIPFDNKIRQDREYRVKKAKEEINRICNRYKVSLNVNPLIEVRPDVNNKHSKKRQSRDVIKTVKKIKRLLKSYKTFMTVNPSVEIRPRDKKLTKKIVTEENK